MTENPTTTTTDEAAPELPAADDAAAPDVAVATLLGVDDDVVPQAARTRSGRAAMTARMRMKKSFGSTVEFLDGAVRPDAGQPTRVRPIPGWLGYPTQSSC